MEHIGSLLHRRYRQGSVGEGAERALLLEEANRWLYLADPRFIGRVAAKAVVGDALVVQCTSSVVQSEVRLRSEALLKYLAESHPGRKIRGLKCLVRGGRLEADEGPIPQS